MKCKKCNEKYNNDNNKSYYILGYCSRSCYYSTDEFRLKYLTTFIKNREPDYNSQNLQELEEKYKIYKLEELKISQVKRVKTMHSKNMFVKIGTEGNKTKKINFLLQNNIVETVENLSQNEINKLFLLNFNRISKHGEKVLNGMVKKYGVDKLTEIKRKQQNDYILKRIDEMGYDIENLSNHQLSKIKHSIYRDFNDRSKEEILNWKIAHIVKFYKSDFNDFENIDAVNKLYSEYLSIRMQKLPESIKSGWKYSKKGFYNFENIKCKYFYRSSWELEVLKELDNIAKNNGIVKSIKYPSSILFSFEDKIRRYFPDILINDKIVIEIKPKKKSLEGIDFVKISEGFKIFKDNFYVLTEEEIFGNLNFYLLEILKGEIK